MKALTHIFFLAATSAMAVANVETISTHGRNVYRLAVAELDGQGDRKEIVGSTYDNRVCAFAADGSHRWDAPVGGFVFDLATGDLDDDGRDEVIAASADGVVYAFSYEGQLLWKHDLQAPVYQVTIAKLDGHKPVVVAGGVSREIVALNANGAVLVSKPVDGVIRILRAGDFDGGGADAVAALLIGGFARQDMHFFKGSALDPLVEKIARGTQPRDPAMNLKQANGIVSDLDGDGAHELIWKPGAYSLKGGLHSVFTLPPRFKERSYDSHYNMRLVASGDLTDRPGCETVILEGAQIGLYDAAGRELGHATAPFGFTDVVYAPGRPHGSVLLGSSPNGDDNLYRLTFAPGWEKSLERLERRGVMAKIGGDLQHLGDAAAAWRGEAMPGADGPFDVIVGSYWWNGGDPKRFGAWIAEVRDYEKQFPYSRLRFAFDFWPSEKSSMLRPDGKPWGRERRLTYDQTRAQIVAAANHFETQRCPFWIHIGHSSTPYVEVATVAAMLTAAPTMLRGFISSEAEPSDTLPYYFEHFLKPVLELCVQHQRRLIVTSKNIAWAHTPADPALRASILDPRYRSALLPSVEDSNSRSPDVNLSARVGLWLDGQVDDWAVRSAADWFSFNRDWEWEYPMTGHPQLRYYVAQAFLGARVFMTLNGEREPRTGRWTRVGNEGTATFLHLLGRGVITPPRRDQLRAISPVALVVKNPSERFAQHGANGHQEASWNNDGTDRQPWAFDRLDCYWGMAPLPPTDVATYLWGRTRRDPSQLATTTSHGFVALVPGKTPRADGPWQTLWTTNGDRLVRDGESLTLRDARTALMADLAAGAKAFPFAVTGRVFHQIIEVSPQRYVLALVDPGWLDPADRTVRIAVQIPGRWQAVDRLTGATLGPLDEGLSLTVSAGTIRLIELQFRPPAIHP